MLLLLRQDGHAAAAKRRRRVGEREQRPREELRGLELVVGEGVQDASTLRRVRHPGDGGHLDLADGVVPQAGRPYGALDEHRRPRLLVREVGRRRPELGRQRGGLEEGEGVGADLHGPRLYTRLHTQL